MNSWATTEQPVVGCQSVVVSWSDPASLSLEGHEQLGSKRASRCGSVVGSWRDLACLSREGCVECHTSGSTCSFRVYMQSFTIRNMCKSGKVTVQAEVLQVEFNRHCVGGKSRWYHNQKCVASVHAMSYNQKYVYKWKGERTGRGLTGRVLQALCWWEV